MTGDVRLRVHVEGIVQGVGFRPFVYGLATRMGLAGFVGNDSGGVVLEVEGDAAALRRFLDAIETHPPPLSDVQRIRATPLRTTGANGFAIADSRAGGPREVPISPDTATCDDCLRELWDPRDRRYGYPFVNCTNCGPRFTIVTDVPYDRPSTTMARFAMCADCAREYHDPSDRRFHAQPVCCPACGPALALTDEHGQPIGGEPLSGAVEALTAGQVVAIKGLGGYHLATIAHDHAAVAALRQRKHREDKPFAVMAADLDAAAVLCEISPDERRLLSSHRRPIVLLQRRSDARLAPAVAPGNRQLGVMLPYTPLHHLLAAELAAPFVLTSGNISDEPIAYGDADARERLAGIADRFLAHDRPIHVRTDDSVTRVFAGAELILRRSRGYVPQPLALPSSARRPLLACGAELKNTFCLAKGRYAFVSHHVGDLENYETYRSLTDGIEHFSRLFDIRPAVIAHDLHPDYLSTKYAVERAERDGLEAVGVQHHHAHVASCLADNGRPGPVIGVAFDGLGYGTDGTIWGGEVLIADLEGFRRVGHLEPVVMPGGAAAITQPWRMAAAYLDVAYDGDPPADLAVARRNAARWPDVVAVARSRVNSPATSSAGRLFDAIAAILGVRDTVNYEGQAAVELEQLVDRTEQRAYPVSMSDKVPMLISGADLVRAVVDALGAGVAPPVIAARFHNGIADAVVGACGSVRATSGLSTVALSGGVFQNVVLLSRVKAGLEAKDFEVLLHSRVPPNDGGISLGQAAIAATRNHLER